MGARLAGFGKCVHCYLAGVDGKWFVYGQYARSVEHIRYEYRRHHDGLLCHVGWIRHRLSHCAQGLVGYSRKDDVSGQSCFAVPAELGVRPFAKR